MGIKFQISSKVRSIIIKKSSTDIINKKERVNNSRCRVINIDSTKEDKEKYFQHEYGK